LSVRFILSIFSIEVKFFIIKGRQLKAQKVSQSIKSNKGIGSEYGIYLTNSTLVHGSTKRNDEKNAGLVSYSKEVDR